MNLDKQFDRCVARAGLQTWDKLWQNMWATRQTELLDENYQIKIVCQWFGNSLSVAKKHYLMLKKTEFNRAVGCPEDIPKNAPKSVQAKGGNPATKKAGLGETPVNDGVCLPVPAHIMPQSYPTRTFPTAGNTEETDGDGEVTPDSTPLADKLLRLWDSADEDLRRELKSIAGIVID